MLLFNLRQIVQIVDDVTTEYLVRKDMSNLKDEKCGLAVLVENGLICELKEKSAERLDCQGGCLLPGFVDAHSHPVFAGDRVHEFAMKLAGASYMEVQAAGGGIHFTTSKTQQATESELLADFELIARKMIASGTTTLEAKSGYGLETATELKMLNVLDKANRTLPLEISATFCGAHAVPKHSSESQQTQLIIQNMIPAIIEQQQQGRLTSTENIDVFCEKNVFELEATERILKAGSEAGFRINIHADELHPLGGAELAANLKATAASHLEEISEQGIKAMAAGGTVAVLLPSTAYILRLKPPPARAMIEQGVIVALGSDFNPNAHCLAMSMIMHLACVNLHLSMKEALVAGTLNAAHSLGRGRSHGAIAVCFLFKSQVSCRKVVWLTSLYCRHLAGSTSSTNSAHIEI